MDQLKHALDFCIRHQDVLSYSMVSLLTAVCEYVFSAVLFKCPCNSDNMLYGIVFLLVPAFILFLLGCIWNARIWRLVTGCHSGNRCSFDLRRSYTCKLIRILARASVAPLTWIAVALLGASFYECAASGNDIIKNFLCKDKGKMCRAEAAKIPCNETLSEMSKGALSLQAQSQLIGLFLILAIVIVGVISTCVSHCCSPVSYMQLKFWKIYLKQEGKIFKIKAKEHAATLAERNINSFFLTADQRPPQILSTGQPAAPTAFQTPSNEDWQKISLPYTFNPQEQYYSMVHKFVNTGRGSTDRFAEQNQNASVLDFVDEIDLKDSGV
ncbi:CAHM6 protein, partial [Ramphastos sulfuratus]|nr:CAHM6 protein [Ramphastos sulfuratus]